MSEENVEIVRKSFARFNSDGFLPEDLWHSDAELSNISESPIPSVYRGYEGLRRWRNDLLEVVEGGRFEVTDSDDVDEADAVVCAVRFRGRAKHTGIEVDLPLWTVSWLREARIYRGEAYRDRAEALEAARPSE